MKTKRSLISIIIPCYNEYDNVDPFYKSLTNAISDSSYEYEFIYVNDGSLDKTLQKLHTLAKKDRRIRILNLSRNFGKEVATTAGIHHANGDALIIIDADGQHPAELIPAFIRKWEQGAKVVVGIRATNQNEGVVKRYGSKLFYRLFNSIATTKLVPGTTDFRLIDRVVKHEFARMTERNRITRGLVDWLGFKQEYIVFHANSRIAGTAGYSFSKLFSLALNSFVSLSLKPLYLSFYIGLVILPASVALAFGSGLEMLLHDPLHLHITGTAYLVMLVLFLLGMVLISQGITALYLSHIYTETQNRPLYIIDSENSLGIGATRP